MSTRRKPTSPPAGRSGHRRAANDEAPRAQAEFVEPMKALAVSRPPDGDWLSEIKFDGYRALAVIRGGHAALWSRNRHVITPDYPAVAAALGRLKCDEAVLDGEIVALDADGRPRFQLLQQRGDGGAPIFYYLFDLLELDGRSLVATPIEERKAMLQRLLAGAADPLRISAVFPVPPAELLEEVRRQGLEGVVMKAAGSRYEPGRRGGSWLKCRLAREQEFVIGGCTPPAGARVGFGALLVGYHQDGKLIYAGKVGTGFTTRTLRELGAQFRPLRRGTSPFANLPLAGRPRWGTGMSTAEMSGVTWLRPTLVAQIRFAEWTEDGLLRQPVFLGLRDDKPAHAVRREALAS